MNEMTFSFIFCDFLCFFFVPLFLLNSYPTTKLMLKKIKYGACPSFVDTAPKVLSDHIIVINYIVISNMVHRSFKWS